MKHLLITIILVNCYLLHSQQHVDTTEVKRIRYEWKISTVTKDSTLNTTLTEYKSGFFKEETNFINDYYANNLVSRYDKKRSKNDSLNEFGFYEVYKENVSNPLSELDSKQIYVKALSNNLMRLYYDKYNNIDSLVNTINRPVSEKVIIVRTNVYKRKDKLKYIITNSSGDSITFKYNFFGRLKVIEFYKDEKLHKTLHFKRKRLVSEKIFNSKRFKDVLRYEYNKKGQIIKEDINDYDFFRYKYQGELLVRKEQVQKRDNVIKNYTVYVYGNDNLIKSKKIYETPDSVDVSFGKKDELIEEYFYTYE